MTKIFALYDTLRQSDKAVKEVTAADFDGLDIRVIQELPGGEVGPGVPTGTPVPSNLSSSGVAAAMASAKAGPLGDSDLTDAQKRFLTRGVKQGGTIVLVDAPSPVVQKVSSILKENGGRVLPD